MEFTATDHDLMIDYKIKGKIYNSRSTEDAVKAAKKANPGLQITSAPFDTETILKGNTWTLPEGAELINERVLST